MKMPDISYQELDHRRLGFRALVAGLALVLLIALGAAWHMEHNGHHVTGMTNQIVWGMPHVFAIFLIVAASGALNVASIGSVFGKSLYKPLARLSALLALALLAGGLAVLVLDLGRPDRLIVAMTHYNFKSIFAWNIFLYTGFFAIVGVYLWLMMDRAWKKQSSKAGVVAFVWRLILTTGTGSIFGFLMARDAYSSAIMAPLFIAMSLAFGTAFFTLVLFAAYAGEGRPLGNLLPNRLRGLLATFVLANAYFVAAQHLTNLYVSGRIEVERFLLAEGGVYTQLFWGAQILFGTVLPLLLLLLPGFKSRAGLVLASVFVLLGGLAQLYVILIGGQAFPLAIFPGYEVRSSFFDGGVNVYAPSAPEFLLGLGGVSVALLIVVLAAAVLRFLPASLADADLDPHARKKALEGA
jgi:Ni/Fe-hydrogenase subunit HybB-like protein